MPKKSDVQRMQVYKKVYSSIFGSVSHKLFAWIRKITVLSVVKFNITTGEDT